MNKNDRNERKVVIDSDAREFAKLTFKKFKKKNDEDYTKKELRQAYYLTLIDLLPEAINFCVRSGYIQTDEVQEVKNGCYEKFIDHEFLMRLKKVIKDDPDDVENIKLFPIVAKDIFEITAKENRRLRSEDPNALQYDLTSLAKVVKLINKKKLKKFAKLEVDEALAFDICCVIPTDKCLTNSQNFRIKQFYEVLYETAKGKTIPFTTIMKVVVKDSAYIPVFVLFALLERKDKYANLTDSQKALYVDITNWALKTLESFDKETIRQTLNVYVKQRKKSELQGHDSRRRYDLQSLSEVDYPKVVKTINQMIVSDDALKAYL